MSLFEISSQIRSRLQIRAAARLTLLSAVLLIPLYCFGDAPDIVWTTNAASEPLQAVAVSPDGALVASGANNDVKLWRADGPVLVRAFVLRNEDIYVVAFSPDGNYLASGGWKETSEDGGGTLRFWTISDGSLVLSDFGGSGVSSLAFSRDSQWFARVNSSGNSVSLRSLSGLLGSSAEPPGGGSCVTFSPTVKIIATGSGYGWVTLWDYTNRLSDEALLTNYVGQADRVTSAVFLPDGSRLVSSSIDGTIVIRRVSDGVIEWTLRDSAPVGSVVVAPDGKTLLTQSDRIKFWRVSDGSLLQAYDPEQVTAPAISPTGKFFVYGKHDGTLVLARMPLWIEQITRNGNEVTLRWQGGSGLYQLQARNDLSTGQWENVGNSTTNTTVTHSCLSPTFFRIQSLPNP